MRLIPAYSLMVLLCLPVGAQTEEVPVMPQKLQGPLVSAVQEPPVVAGKTYRDPTSGIEFVAIPAGSFMMGSNEGEGDEKPPHSVKVKGFYLARTEVTMRSICGFCKSHGL